MIRKSKRELKKGLLNVIHDNTFHVLDGKGNTSFVCYFFLCTVVDIGVGDVVIVFDTTGHGLGFVFVVVVEVDCSVFIFEGGGLGLFTNFGTATTGLCR